MATRQKNSPVSLTLELSEADYQTILKACRVYGLISESVLMEVGKKDGAGEAEFVCDGAHPHPIYGVCNAYFNLHQMAFLDRMNPLTAESLAEAFRELGNGATGEPAREAHTSAPDLRRFTIILTRHRHEQMSRVCRLFTAMAGEAGFSHPLTGICARYLALIAWYWRMPGETPIRC